MHLLIYFYKNIIFWLKKIIYTVVAKIIRTLVFSPAKFFFLNQLFLSFAVVWQ